MPRVLFLELPGLLGNSTSSTGKGYVFEQETGRLIQELSFKMEEGSPPALDFSDGPDGAAGAAGLEAIDETVLSLPLEELGIRALDIPFSDRERLRDILPYELEGLVLGDPQQMVIDAVPLEDPPGMSDERDQKQRVLAVYIGQDKLSHLLDSFREAGIDPGVVTSSGLGQLVQALQSGKELSALVGKTTRLDDEQALDCARREVMEPTANFRMGKFAYTKEAERTRRTFIWTVALAAALLLALAAHMALKAATVNKSADAIENNTLQIYSELFGEKMPDSAKGLRYKAEAKIKALRGKAKLYREAGVLDLLMDLKDTTAEGLKMVEITVDSNAVILRGTAATLEDVHTLKDQLGEFLQDVSISESGAAASGNIAFSISARKAPK